MKKIILFLSICAATIELTAQTPTLPLPPYVIQNRLWVATHMTNALEHPSSPMPEVLMPRIHPAPKKAKTYTAPCPHCRMILKGLEPLATISVQNDVLSSTTQSVTTIRSFLCSDCNNPFIAVTRETIEIPIAIEDPIESPAASMWTTNPNLRLVIEILNKTNVLVLTGLTNNTTISNTVTLGISPFPMAAVRFPTELGKTYKCQASDDNYTNGDPRKVWFDGPIVAGTGHSITNYEIPVKEHRIYRVVENPTL